MCRIRYGGSTSYWKIICTSFTNTIMLFYILSLYCCCGTIMCGKWCVFVMDNMIRRLCTVCLKNSLLIATRRCSVSVYNATVSKHQIITIQCRYFAHLRMVNWEGVGRNRPCTNRDMILARNLNV
jgi:hypothetical protein